MSKFITSDPPYNAGLYPTTAGFLELANGVALSSTLTHVTDQLNNLSPLELSTNQVRIGRESNDTPLALFGTKGSLAIFNTFSVGSGNKTFSFPNASMTFAGIDIAQTFTGLNNFTTTQNFNVPNDTSGTSNISIPTRPHTNGGRNTNHPTLVLGSVTGSIWGNTGFGTYLGINAPTGWAGNLIDLKFNDTTVLNITQTGALTSTSSITAGGIISSTAASGNSAFSMTGGQLFSSAGYGMYQYSSRHFFDLDGRGVAFNNNVYIGANSAATGRLHVLGATSQNIVRFDDNTSTPRFIVPNSGAITIGSGTSINAISFFGPTTFNGETSLTSMGNAGYGSCFYFSGSAGSANFTTLGVNIGATTNAKGALLRLGAGTAAANTAPLKFTAGTLLTTPENGAFEFDGSFLYFTIGGVRLKVTLAP